VRVQAVSLKQAAAVCTPIAAAFRPVSGPFCVVFRLFILPRDSGEGGPSCAAGWWKGRLTRRFVCFERDSSRPAPPPPRFAWSPSPAIAGADDTASRSRAALFVRAPSFANGFTKRASPRGRRSAERRVLRDHSAQSQRCRWAGSWRAPLLADALAFRRSTAALARDLSALAQSGPALHGSANGCDSVRHPGSELLADRRRGRPGGFPNRPRMELRTPSRAPLPLASTGRHRLTSLGTSRMESFSSASGVDSRTFWKRKLSL
jgi:hypothetical protein